MLRVKRKHWLWILVVVVGAALVWLALAPKVVDVEAVAAVRAPLRVTVDEEGETRLRRRFVVSAPVPGKVLRIETRPGDAVTKGQTLAVIQPAALMPLDARTQMTGEARVRAADAAVSRANSDRQRLAVELKQAEADASRAKALLDAGYGSRDVYEQATARVGSLREAVAAADSAIRAAGFEAAAAKATLISRGEAAGGRAVTVTAPIAGRLLRRMQESEAVVPAGAPLVEIGTLDDLEIVTDYLSTDAVKIKPGAPVIIDRWGGEGTLAGRVQRVEPAGFLKISALGVEEQRVNVIVDFVDPREKRAALGDGFRVEVRVVIWEGADAITVPTASLFRRQGEWSVFVINGDVLKLRTVKVGQRNEQAAQILEGLSPGERVVAYPGESLSDGTKVRTR
jgi:HlyD family secretion protein